MDNDFEDVEVPSVPPPDIPKTIPEDERYLILLTKPLEVCAKYRSKFGQGGTGVSVDEFQSLYGGDPFYSWMGLDSPLMYAAHKAAGGMTSVYRQLGIGAQWIFNQDIQSGSSRLSRFNKRRSELDLSSAFYKS